MGQGYSLTSLSAGSATIDVPELSDLEFEKSLGNARFMKCIRARRKEGLVVAKIVMKPSPNKNWDDYVHELNVERKELSDIPNALGYHRIQQTSMAGYLVRQYIHSSLYDRMSTRPFLDPIEKKWLAFQLLCAVRDCHAKNLYHGDIKTENVLVTSWNWLFLTDFSSAYKPTYLPEDNPADFNFFFDTSSSASARRTCYLAPERFLRPGEDSTGKSKLNWAMDIFSVGCVIAELFMESPIFSLAQLFKYRSKEYDPSAHLDNIKDKDIREMIAHMIQLDPQDRYSAEEYLGFWKQRAFPEYFYSFLHQYMYLITDPTSGRRPITAGQENLGEADDRIDRVYFDFDKISFFLGYDTGQKTDQDPKPASGSRANLFPLQIDVPNNRHQASALIHKPVDNGSLLFLTLVEASVRSTARATARLRAIELMLAFAERVPDEVKLDRILPFLMELLNDDQTEAVKVTALRAITQLLELVHTLTAVNAYVFPEYILLRLNNHVLSPKKNPSAWLRATYASCLSSLAGTASRFLDMMQALRSEGSLAGGNIQSEVGKLTGSSYQHYQNLYDSARNDLMAQFEQHTTTLLTDSDTAVRRAFLGSISTLCVFFGSTRASDVILSHLNTYLNDRDWELKCAFFETIVGVATYVGGPSLEEFILPLMVQSLTDPEETVIERVLRSFSAIAGLGLFQRSTTWELVDIVGRFTMHPNTWIREAAVEFIAAASKYLTVADCHGIIIPLIKVYLSTLPSELSELVLLDVLKKPMPRLVFDMALTWSVKTEKGVFWKAAQTQRTFTFGAGDHNLPTISGQNLGPRAFNRIPKNDEDEQWIQRLRNAGMEHEDEFKLVALREFIWRVAHRKSQVDAGSTPSPLNAVVKLSEINIKPQIVIFDQDHNKFRQTAMRQNGNDQRHRTIAEALQDATSQASNIPAAQDGSRASPQPGPVTIPSRPAASQESDSRVQSPTGLDVPRPKGTLSPLSGPTVSSSLDSKASFRLTDHNHSMARKGSAINLMGRAEAGSKATAELGTTQENAFGQVATGASGREVAKRSSTLGQTIDNHRRNPQRTKQQTAHNYSGNDPGVLRLLDSLYLDNYPVDYIEFGPMFTPRRREPIKRAGGQAATGPWRPDGNLVAFLGEHTAAINRVVVAPDHNFFVTGSDDGTVKVWDTSRLERNTTHRSRHTYRHAPGTKVTSLTFIEDTHCFVSTGSDGSVHIVRVDFTQKHDESSQSSPRYGKLKVVREYSLPDGEHSVWCEHFKEENRSILILATNKCRVIALELRTMTELYVLSNPLHHGTPLCFCVDKKHHWLLLGTSHGILDLWDLRFRLRLKAWGFSAGSPIHRISLVPSRSSRQHKVAIAGGTGQGEVTIWDIEKAICTNVYRTGLSKENTKGYKLIENDEERSGGMLGRFATSSEPSSNAGMDRGIRAIAMGLHVLEGSDPRFYFFVSAGPDWKVRFWDSARHESSMVVSGMELEEGRPSYTVSQPSHDLTVVSETLSPPPPISGSSTASTPVASPARGVVAGSAGKRSGRDKARSSIISMQQQHLLKSHLDTVTDVALLEVPYGMVVSVDRSGLIYVFS